MHSADAIDYAIMEKLQENGRTRRNDLAEMVGLSIPSVSERLKKLEEGGYITGYYAKLDHKKVGRDITAFIYVFVDSSRHYQTFVEHAIALDEVIECHAITGDGSHMLKIRTENTSTLETLLGKIQSWTGVNGTKTNLVLSTTKETTHVKLTTPARKGETK